MIVVINLIGCLEKDASIRSEIKSVFNQFFMNPKKVILKSMDGRFDKKKRKIICDNYSFMVDYEKTFASIPVEELGHLMCSAFCQRVDLYQII